MNEDMVEVIFQSQREINEEDGCLNEAYVEGCKVFKKKGGGGEREREWTNKEGRKYCISKLSFRTNESRPEIHVRHGYEGKDIILSTGIF